MAIWSWQDYAREAIDVGKKISNSLTIIAECCLNDDLSIRYISSALEGIEDKLKGDD